MVTGKEFAQQAKSTKYDKIKYEQCDCQGFVERVLYDSGVHKPDGPYIIGKAPILGGGMLYPGKAL